MLFRSTNFYPIVWMLLLLLFVFNPTKASAEGINMDTAVVVVEYKIIGNKTTKNHIIEREFPFSLNDTISKNKLNYIIERTQSNLMNTLLFNFVNVDVVYFTDEIISIYVTVEERWYWWPLPIFEVQETNFNTWWETKNFDRVNYGLYLAKENFRGRKERLVFKAQGGYTEKAEFRYHVPYLNKKQTQGFMVGFNYNRNHEVMYGTTDNKRDFVKMDELYLQEQFVSRINYEYRPKLYNLHSFEVRHHYFSIADTVFALSDEFLEKKDNNTSLFSFLYTFKRDKRNFKSYPTKGYFAEFNVIKNGFGISDHNIDALYGLFSLRKYWKMGSRTYFAVYTKGKYSLERPPFYLLGGLGYNNNLVRGYEFYVIHGEHYGLAKTQFRYALVDNKITYLPFLFFEKFKKVPLSVYSGLFFDTGYVYDRELSKTNSLNNTHLYSAGVALDFVTYYDVVFRVEYSINHLNEHGLFLHFVAPL